MTKPAAAALLLAGTLLPSLRAGDMRDLIELYSADRATLVRYFSSARPGPGAGAPPAPDTSPQRRERFRKFYSDWLARVEQVPFDRLSRPGQIDFLLFVNHLNRELRQLDLQEKALEETSPLLPFAPAILNLEHARRRMEPLDPAQAAAIVAGIRKQTEAARRAAGSAKRHVAYRATSEVDSLRGVLRTWFAFYNGYNPIFTWWLETPQKEADKALTDYAAFLREKIVGLKPGDNSEIVGNPNGREALLSELRYEMIPYSPEELLDIANREFAWCDQQMLKASREMGFGDDWHKALESVKNDYVEPGRQPALIRDLALQAIDFVEKHDLVTIPPLARDTWRMEMMSPERQLVNPFFTGGDTISVSYPTAGMTQEQKLMSMRGNNVHFAHATVFHELIPGHELQGFMAARYAAYRAPFSTAFLTEGWALYWEMLLWDLNFNTTPQDRVGALFWRMHRCARIIFSLSFHLGKMTPVECIEFLVTRVGFERDNATAEVRRSFDGSYGPLYQISYMIGGLQIRALHRDLVASGKMTSRAFHDAILSQNRIPIEMIRATLSQQKLTRDFTPQWRFYEAAASH